MLYVDNRDKYVPTALSERMETWCFDRGIEVIPLGGSKVKESELDTNAFQERFGVDRILETLETNMWPQMTYKTELRPAGEATMNVSFASHLQGAQDAISSLLLSESKTSSHENGHLNGNNNVSDSHNGSNGSNGTGLDTLGLNTTEELMEMNEPSFPLDENFSERELKQLESFEQTLQQLSTLREQAKGFSDEQRREFAAQVAMSFLSQLDSDDE